MKRHYYLQLIAIFSILGLLTLAHAQDPALDNIDRPPVMKRNQIPKKGTIPCLVYMQLQYEMLSHVGNPACDITPKKEKAYLKELTANESSCRKDLTALLSDYFNSNVMELIKKGSPNEESVKKSGLTDKNQYFKEMLGQIHQVIELALHPESTTGSVDIIKIQNLSTDFKRKFVMAFWISHEMDFDPDDFMETNMILNFDSEAKQAALGQYLQLSIFLRNFNEYAIVRNLDLSKRKFGRGAGDRRYTPSSDMPAPIKGQKSSTDVQITE